MSDNPTVFEAIQFLDNDCELKWEKQSFSPAEQLAIIALRPFLPAIGGRIMQMMIVAKQEKQL